jgi:hypothetical protein
MKKIYSRPNISPTIISTNNNLELTVIFFSYSLSLSLFKEISKLINIKTQKEIALISNQPLPVNHLSFSSLPVILLPLLQKSAI